MTPDTVFETIASRFASRSGELGLFLDSGVDFEPWCIWEAFAACRDEGWPAWPFAAYSKVGLLGSRESADLLVGGDAGVQVIVELGLIHCWSTNRWIASIDQDTRSLSRAMTAGVKPLQLVLAVSPEPVGPNELWSSWLEMTSVWPRPTGLEHAMSLGGGRQALLRGWALAGP